MIHSINRNPGWNEPGSNVPLSWEEKSLLNRYTGNPSTNLNHKPNSNKNNHDDGGAGFGAILLFLAAIIFVIALLSSR